MTTFRRRSINSVLHDPRPEDEFYVLAVRGYPKHAGKMSDDDNPFHEYDQSLSPTWSLMDEYDEDAPVEPWNRKFVSQVGEYRIKKKADHYAEEAGERDVVFCCYEPEADYPRCHTWALLDVLEQNGYYVELSDKAAERKAEYDDSSKPTSLSDWGA